MPQACGHSGLASVQAVSEARHPSRDPLRLPPCACPAHVVGYLLTASPARVHCQVERCWLVTGSGNRVELEPTLEGAQMVFPTFTPAHFERAMNTRSAASSIERRHRTMHVWGLPPLVKACKGLWNFPVEWHTLLQNVVPGRSVFSVRHLTATALPG